MKSQKSEQIRWLTHVDKYPLTLPDGSITQCPINVWEGKDLTPVVVTGIDHTLTKRAPRIANYVFDSLLHYPAVGMLYFEIQMPKRICHQLHFEYAGNINRPLLMSPERRRRSHEFIDHLVVKSWCTHLAEADSMNIHL